MSPQSTLLILLPVLTPLVGSSVAAILAQDHWPAWANDAIAWTVLLAIAAGDMYANSQFAGGWIAVAADGVQAVTLLASGWLVKLGPWLAWLSFLQSNVFNLVPLFERAGQATSMRTVTTRATPASVPAPIVLPQPPSGGGK